MKKHLTNKSILKRKRTHGFLSRMRSPTGRNVLRRRRGKKRWQLIPT